MEATVSEVHCADNRFSGYIQWHGLEGEFWNENAKNDLIVWLYPRYFGVLIYVDGRSFVGQI